ncbi:MAG: carotenoid biosynthesis protein [Rikenellaceae bacterium]|nr:carotenoid biosynthesis protein [Rikenellaceae bacterium]
MNKRFIENELPWTYIRFYAVGALLFMIPFTRGIFISITTLSLLLVIFSVFYFNRDWNSTQVAWGIFIVTSSYLLEYYGVATGTIFGEYIYGRGLAPLIKGTPLIIGLNWLFLIYSTHLIANKTCGTVVGRIVCASLLMLLYDVVAEWVAPYMKMWSFSSGYPPLRNFSVWFAASVFYHTGFELIPLRHDNPSARFLYAVQIVFFIVIGIFSQIVIK